MYLTDLIFEDLEEIKFMLLMIVNMSKYFLKTYYEKKEIFFKNN